MSQAVNVEYGTRHADLISGTDGKDLVIAKAGDDTIDTGDGNDKIDGGKGDDIIDAGAGDDKVDAGKGDDVVDGGAGNDKVDLGAGNDVAVYSVSENAGFKDVYDGGSGKDTLRIVLTAAEWARADIQADLARFQDFLGDDGGGHGGKFRFKCGDRGQDTFRFDAFDLEELRISRNRRREYGAGSRRADNRDRRRRRGFRRADGD